MAQQGKNTRKTFLKSTKVLYNALIGQKCQKNTSNKYGSFYWMFSDLKNYVIWSEPLNLNPIEENEQVFENKGVRKNCPKKKIIDILKWGQNKKFEAYFY